MLAASCRAQIKSQTKAGLFARISADCITVADGIYSLSNAGLGDRQTWLSIPTRLSTLKSVAVCEYLRQSEISSRIPDFIASSLQCFSSVSKVY